MALPVYSRTDAARGRESNAWDPMAEIERELIRNFGGLAHFAGDAVPPGVDVEETDDAYVVEVELAGVKKDDIDISLDGRRLTITGERKEKERVGILRRRTRPVGRFHVEVLLPGDVDENGVTASLQEGVLTVRVPKATTGRSRRIEVK